MCTNIDNAPCKVSADIFYYAYRQPNILEAMYNKILSLISHHLRETAALIIMLGIVEKLNINISVVERGIYDPIKLYTSERTARARRTIRKSR